VFAFATHALFSHPALQKIEKSQIEEIVVCDTIKPRPVKVFPYVQLF
jgi:ribose-phosphate pyrophosphokinase